MLDESHAAVDTDDAFQELFTRHYRRVVGFFLRRGFDVETCHELSQEVFFRVYRSRASFRGDVPVASWLFTVAGNLYRNELRRLKADKRNRQEVSLDDTASEASRARVSATASAPAGPLARSLDREQIEAVREAIGQLPPQMRRATQMKVAHGLGVSQIARLMKVSESTVKVHLHHARKKLRVILTDRFGDLSF